jgi:pectinesterase
MKINATAIVAVLAAFASLAFSQAPETPPTTQPHDVSVTPDGKSIQATIDALARNAPTRQTVTFAPGEYRQRVEIHKDLINVTFRAEGKPEDVRIVTARAAGQIDAVTGKKIGTSGSEVVLVIGDGFTAENITFENDAGEIGQAVAVRTTGDRAVFRNCRFLGWQDTLYTNGKRHYFQGCHIEGRVDFIFGRATAVFEDCTIKSKNGGYITAASTNPDTAFGLVFMNCKLISDDHVPTYLGRPWRPHASVTYINCEIGGHIRPEGWDNWRNQENEKTARYSEYGNTGPGADPSKRVAWARQLTKEEAEKITVESVLFGEDKWDAKSQK